jgi:hypothetical protein
MTQLGKQGLSKAVGLSAKRLYSEALWYSKTNFGIQTDSRSELVSTFCLEISAVQLKKSFKIFEEMPNVHEWPISKLIQRELDKQRASRISRDYLLSDGYLKYFPPITAVLIPTNRDHIPTDSYPKPSNEEESELRKHVQIILGDAAADFVNVNSVIAGGIYDIDDGSGRGYLIWDESLFSAVVIDGQHRYKAILDAMNSNKDFNLCRLTVNLIDLIPICNREKTGPTAVARDLFVSINNTPEEVDEARLVLMDDRDVLATFTQVLVDDSDNDYEPVLRPELIDWRCDQGKHDSSLALTGVLTLRGVIGSAMFSSQSIASVQDREDRKRVKSWLSYLNQWISPDEEIEQRLKTSETLRHRFEIACAANDDEELSQPFLFSYSAAAASVMKARFRNLYLSVFRKVYREVTPFAKVIDIASSCGAFEKSKDLHRFLRAFSSQRGEMLEIGEMAQLVVAYKKKIKDFSENHILLTVMGQKALFKALFECYLSEVAIDKEELADQAGVFVDAFNEVYELVHKSNSYDECFFSTRFCLKHGIETTRAGDLGREFWRGIILGHNGEIDYGPGAIDLLKQILIDILLHEEGPFEFTDNSKIIKRHIGILRKFNSEIEDETAYKIATKIVARKQEVVGTLLA